MRPRWPGAFLGRALLLQGRVDEADEVAADAERLAGADLKAGIAWRDVRAEAAARRGDTTRALALAREAVELASATDALLLVADARLALAVVLRATGDTDAADAEAQRAVDACEAKGATVLEARARSAMTVQPAAPRTPVAEVVDNRVALFENDVTRNIAHVHAGYHTRDWEAIQDSYAEDWAQDDRRSVVSMSLNHEESIASSRMIFDGGGWLDRKTIATRGLSLAAGISTLHIPDHGVITSVLMVTRTDDAGRQQHTTQFDVDDLDGGLTELDRLFLEGEGATHAGVFELVMSFVGALGRRDVEAAAALADPDFVVRDHRLVGSPPQSIAEWLPSLQDALDRLDDGGCVRLEHVLRLSEHGCLFSYVHEGAVSDGVDFEVRVLMALRVRDGRLVSLDSYDEHDMDAAYAALDARGANFAAEHFANAAWRAELRLQRAQEDRSWQGFLDALAPGFELHENRAGTQIDAHGDAALDMYRVLYSLDDWAVERSLLATHGDRLALVEDRTWFVDGAAGESEVLSLEVVESDDNELVVAIFTFDIEDLDRAYDALDARYVELGGPDLRPYRHALDARDWERYASFFEADASIDDRRRAGDGRVNRDWLIAYQRAIVDLPPDVTLRIDHVEAATPSVSLIVTRFVGTRDDGAFEMFSVSLASTGSTGLISSVTLYDIGDLDAARAHYARLTAPSLDDHFPNLASRVLRRHEAAANARATGTRSALRSRRRWNTTTTALASASHWSAMTRAGLAGDVRRRRVAARQRGHRDPRRAACPRPRHGRVTRRRSRHRRERRIGGGGDRRGGAHFPLPFVRLRRHDRCPRRARPRDSRPSVAAPCWRRCGTRSTRRDWDTLASLSTEGCTIVDHRTAGWGSVNRDVFVDYQRSVVALADDAHLWVDHVRERGNVSISTGRAFGTRAGGAWEIAFVTVGVADAEWRPRQFETYELGDMAVALARFHELVAAEEAEPFANAAWRAVSAQVRAVHEHRWEAFAATLAPDFEHDDRRSMLGRVDRGPDAFATPRWTFALDDMRLETTLLATRGDRLVLVRTTAAFHEGDTGSAEVVCLNVNQVNELGLVTHTLLFDGDDMTAALAELDQRDVGLRDSEGRLAGENAPPVENLAWRAAEEQARSVGTHDWEAYLATLAPNTVVDDRRSGIGIVARGDEALYGVHHVAFTLDRCRLDRDLLATRGDRLALHHTTVTFEDGVAGPAEITCLMVHEVDEHGRVTAMLAFDLGDPTGALAELEGALRLAQRALPAIESRVGVLGASNTRLRRARLGHVFRWVPPRRDLG